MQRFLSKKIYVIFSLLSFFYIALLLGMITIHYQELISVPNTNIYDVMYQHNWEYWLEAPTHMQTTFSTFLQFIDIQYLHSQGIISISINVLFIFLFIILISIMIKTLFPVKENPNKFIQNILVFSTVIILFSAIQDSSIVWMFNQQLFAAYFFPLLSYYLLVKLSENKNIKYFYILIFSIIMIILATPYDLSALMVLLLIGLVLKIGWIKNLIISVFTLLSFFLNYHELINNILLVGQLNGDMSTNFLHYMLNYLGSIFVYLSFEPCCATSSIIGGLFVIGSFIYFTYLVLSKKVTELIYWIILAFLLFYILSAFGSFMEIPNNHIIMFKNQYLTPSLIAWLLIFVLYIHHFNRQQILQRRVITLLTTFIAVLFFYQIFSYQHFRQDTSKLKLAAMSLKLGINDPLAINKLIRSNYIMMYIPSKGFDQKMSIFTINDIKIKVIQHRANLLKGNNPINFTYNATKNVLADDEAGVIPKTHSLTGDVETIIPSKKKENIYRILGWVYNIKEKEVPERLVVFDEKYNLIGYVITGLPRKDVEMQYGKNSVKSGFNGYIRYLKTPHLLVMVGNRRGEILKVKYSDSIQ